MMFKSYLIMMIWPTWATHQFLKTIKGSNLTFRLRHSSFFSTLKRAYSSKVFKLTGASRKVRVEYLRASNKKGWSAKSFFNKPISCFIKIGLRLWKAPKPGRWSKTTMQPVIALATNKVVSALVKVLARNILKQELAMAARVGPAKVLWSATSVHALMSVCIIGLCMALNMFKSPASSSPYNVYWLHKHKKHYNWELIRWDRVNRVRMWLGWFEAGTTIISGWSGNLGKNLR